MRKKSDRKPPRNLSTVFEIAHLCAGSGRVPTFGFSSSGLTKVRRGRQRERRVRECAKPIGNVRKACCYCGVERPSSVVDEPRTNEGEPDVSPRTHALGAAAAPRGRRPGTDGREHGGAPEASKRGQYHAACQRGLRLLVKPETGPRGGASRGRGPFRCSSVPSLGAPRSAGL